MTYTEFKAMMAYYGFTYCPLTEAQFKEASRWGLSVDGLYGLGCDVNAGVRFARALDTAVGRMAV